MASKVPIQLKEYKVRKKPINGVPQAGYDTIQCIVNVSADLADYLGVDAYEFPPTAGKPVEDPVNVTNYGNYATGTYHGKTVFIITDGEGGATYKKTYQMQLPNNYPIEFLKQFLESRQSATSNTMRYVKIRNGRRYPVRPNVPVPA